MSVTIKVNGETYEVEEGQWLIDALNGLGFKIPHFCYHPGLGPDGNCRMCQVEYVSERGNRVGISCNQKVAEGMEVLTDSDRVKEVRGAVEEFLLLNHPLDCPICDKAGECTLQDYYYEHDLGDSRQEFTRFKKNKALDIGPTLILDQERCVLCDRCVRFLRDWAGTEQLYIAGRGHEAYLTPFPGKEVDSPYSLNTVDLCPVGALTSKDFRFSSPTWFLTRTPSVCTACSRGCAIEVDCKDGEVKRLRPRHNPHVNGYWMCDEGRLNYKFVNTDRVSHGFVDRGGEKYEASYEEALGEIRGLLGGEEPSRAVILASATCTLEEMYALKKLAATLSDASLHAVRHVPDGEEDNLLRRADRHPNMRGAELLGLPVLDTTKGAGTITGDVVLAVGFDYGIGEALVKLFDGFSRVVMMAARQSALTRAAHVVVPGLTFAEKEGLVINFEGHIQALTPALEPRGDTTTPWKIVADLVSSLTGEKLFENISDLRSALGKDETAFAAVDLNAVGPVGFRLETQTV